MSALVKGACERGKCTCPPTSKVWDAKLRAWVQPSAQMVALLGQVLEVSRERDSALERAEAAEAELARLRVELTALHEERQVAEAREREASASPEREQVERLHAHGPRGQG